MSVQVRRSRFLPPVPAEPQGGTLVFQDGFAAGNFAKWNSLQWSTSGTVRNTAGTAYSGTGEYPAQVVAIDGRTDVARFELRDGDSPFGGTERSEIGEPFTITPGDVECHPGDERWIGWDMKFHSTYPTPDAASGWNLVWQWHNGSADGSPAFVLDMDTDDIIYLANNDASGYQRTAVQAMVRDTWQRWVVHVKFSDNPAIGYADVWVDGVLKINHEMRRTMVVGDDLCYFKCGTYRDPVNSVTAISYYDNLKITAP